MMLKASQAVKPQAHRAREVRTAALAPVHRTRSAANRRSRSTQSKAVYAFQETSTTTLEGQRASPAGTSTSVPVQEAKNKLTISWAGAGVFFFWQLGAIKYLSERYDLSRVQMAGASGGALAAVLGACGVDAERALQLAYQMALDNNVFDNPIGLLGSWGKFIEQWLDELLPPNAADICRNRITVVVTVLPNARQVGITDFKDKADLINCCMASSHIPVLLDYKVTRPCRGMLCVDGSFPDFFYNDNCELLKCGGAAVMFDYFQDSMLERKGRMDMLSVKTYEEIVRIMGIGYSYAHRLHEAGHFSNYDLGEVLLAGMSRAEYPEEVAIAHEHEHAVMAAQQAAAVHEALQQQVQSSQPMGAPLVQPLAKQQQQQKGGMGNSLGRMATGVAMAMQ